MFNFKKDMAGVKEDDKFSGGCDCGCGASAKVNQPTDFNCCNQKEEQNDKPAAPSCGCGCGGGQSK